MAMKLISVLAVPLLASMAVSTPKEKSCTSAEVPVTNVFRVSIDRVVDGDTIDVDINLGLGVVMRSERLRLYGVDTPEKRGKSKQRGLDAEDFTYKWINDHADGGAQFYIRTERTCSGDDKRGKYGRLLATLVAANGNELNAALISQGWRRSY